jgi:hypothetical protein
VSVVGDPFLNYFALGVLVFVVVVLFYGIIAIHDIPHIVAKSRNHPHQDAIQWSLATAALGGIIGIALLLLIMNYNHPFTTSDLKVSGVELV